MRSTKVEKPLIFIFLVCSIACASFIYAQKDDTVKLTPKAKYSEASGYEETNKVLPDVKIINYIIYAASNVIGSRL